MKKLSFLIGFLVVILLEIIILSTCFTDQTNYYQDSVLINETVMHVKNDFLDLKKHKPITGIEYSVIDIDEKVLFQTKDNLSITINQAIIKNDTILDLEIDGKMVGKIIIENTQIKFIEKRNKTIRIIFAILLVIEVLIGLGYFMYLNHTIIQPFHKLNKFAVRIAEGNLDVPLEMDRHNLFGAFTESFDMMRYQLKKARLAEAKASEAKKELVAKLSHDIKTPIASIKASSEVGLALTKEEKTKTNFMQIIQKTDQMNALMNNLFTSTLEELQQLTVTPVEENSTILKHILENADYMHQADIPKVVDALVYVDKFRLQQVFDNIFSNSYKYANTKIDVRISKTSEFLIVEIEDYGKGVPNDEVILLTEKYKRGSNAKDKDGAGLGLYISEYFMKQMEGMLLVENGVNGLKVSIHIRLVGKN